MYMDLDYLLMAQQFAIIEFINMVKVKEPESLKTLFIEFNKKANSKYFNLCNDLFNKKVTIPEFDTQLKIHNEYLNTVLDKSKKTSFDNLKIHMNDEIYNKLLLLNHLYTESVIDKSHEKLIEDLLK